MRRFAVLALTFSAAAMRAGELSAHVYGSNGIDPPYAIWVSADELERLAARARAGLGLDPEGRKLFDFARGMENRFREEGCTAPPISCGFSDPPFSTPPPEDLLEWAFRYSSTSYLGTLLDVRPGLDFEPWNTDYGIVDTYLVVGVTEVLRSGPGGPAAGSAVMIRQEAGTFDFQAATYCTVEPAQWPVKIGDQVAVVSGDCEGFDPNPGDVYRTATIYLIEQGRVAARKPRWPPPQDLNDVRRFVSETPQP